MSKKAGKKTKAKVPEIDPNSPEWLEEVARKQEEAYDMVQRAMTRSQVQEHAHKLVQLMIGNRGR